MAKTSFTGINRRRTTRWTVKAGDMTARVLITMGGIGTIVAVCLVCLFLVSVVLPLFESADVKETNDYQASFLSSEPVHIAIDEYRVMGYALQPDGSIVVYRVDTGKVLAEHQLFDADHPPITAVQFAVDGQQVVFGFADGTMRMGEIGFATTFLNNEDVPTEHLDATAEESFELNGGMAQVTPEGQFRVQRADWTLNEPIDTGAGKPLVLISKVESTLGPVVVALTDDNQLHMYGVSSRYNMLTQKTTYRVRSAEVPFEPGDLGRPAFLALSGTGSTVLVAWKDGTLWRYDARDMQNVTLAEQVDVVPDPAATLTKAKFMLGGTTLVVGDSAGNLSGWFESRTPAGQLNPDDQQFVQAHILPQGETAVTSLAFSSRSRVVGAGYADGSFELFYMTTGVPLVRTAAIPGQPITQLTITAKDDGIVALAGDTLASYDFNPKYPEVTTRSLFGRIWYEGYETPGHTWQSTGGTDDFEPKLGLIPLVFGTIKATIYSMVFAVPLALLAAIYTSEFLHPRIKARIKPMVELMASLPSVVLGFVAGAVIAPLVEGFLPSVLSAFATVPLAFLVGAYVWQTIPTHRRISLQNIGLETVSAGRDTHVLARAMNRMIFTFGGVRVTLLLVMLAIGLLAAWLIGPLMEILLFAGNIKLWMDGQIGNGATGWMIILLPLSGVAVAMIFSRVVNPMLRDRAREWTHGKAAMIDAAKFAAGALATVVFALGVGFILTLIGWDPRGNIPLGPINVAPFDTFDQRNALIVGFIMGFAVIPIIYTIAEDALSAVPDHLRSASLGAGATPWQTATRVIIPTAMSGLFSACMIGLGRAVGETMIVLMAAGNTPVLEMNMFNGFRTLAANIATELPEAVQGSTHYRTLFLAALTLFVMTFIVNTIAEAVRQRFRKRAFQL